MYMTQDLQVIENDETLILRYLHIVVLTMPARTQSIIVVTVLMIGEASKI
jgi:hypothetical protein